MKSNFKYACASVLLLLTSSANADYYCDPATNVCRNMSTMDYLESTTRESMRGAEAARLNAEAAGRANAEIYRKREDENAKAWAAIFLMQMQDRERALQAEEQKRIQAAVRAQQQQEIDNNTPYIDENGNESGVRGYGNASRLGQ